MTSREVQSQDAGQLRIKFQFHISIWRPDRNYKAERRAGFVHMYDTDELNEFKVKLQVSQKLFYQNVFMFEPTSTTISFCVTLNDQTMNLPGRH